MARYPYPYPFQPDEDPRDSKVGWLIVFLLILLVALIIFATPRNLKAPSGFWFFTEQPSFAANPELSTFRRFQAGGGPATSYARNPELIAVQRYQTEQQAFRVAATEDQNPFDAFLHTVDGGMDSAFLAQNPEISLYRRFLADLR